MMFEFQNNVPENTVRSQSGELARFGKAMDKYPPIYRNVFSNI